MADTSIAAAAGLSLAWAIVSPGPRTRGQALAEQGRRVGAIAVGLAFALGVAGLLEAFLTPSTLPAVESWTSKPCLRR